MSSPDHILAIDQGTSRDQGRARRRRAARSSPAARAPVALRTPRPGWVEQDANEIWASRPGRGRRLRRPTQPRRRRRPQHPARVAAAVGPRDGRAARPDAELAGPAHGRRLRPAARARRAGPRDLSGLPLDPMFCATKARWLLDAYGREGVCLGTVDSFLAVQARRRPRDRGRQRRPHAAARRARPRLVAGAARAVRRPARGAARRGRLDRAVPGHARPRRRCRTARRSAP